MSFVERIPSPYPDITDAVEDIKYDLFDDIAYRRFVKGRSKALSEIITDFQPNAKYDLGGPEYPELPNGPGEFGRYKDTLMNGPELTNYLFGQAVGAMGLAPEQVTPVKHLQNPKKIIQGYRDYMGFNATEDDVAREPRVLIGGVSKSVYYPPENSSADSKPSPAPAPQSLPTGDAYPEDTIGDDVLSSEPSNDKSEPTRRKIDYWGNIFDAVDKFEANRLEALRQQQAALNSSLHGFQNPLMDWQTYQNAYHNSKAPVSNFWKGFANGAVAGAGPQADPNASNFSRGAYQAGDFLGTVGTNLAALQAGPLAPAVWAAYGAAREANREIDLHRARHSPNTLNPAAIAASGALNTLPGSMATRVPLNTLGRALAGSATGYATDLAARGIEQFGNTGQLDPSSLDFTPGLGTAFGGLSGSLAGGFLPTNRVQQSKSSRPSTPVPYTLNDLFSDIQLNQGVTPHEINFWTNQTTVPPHNSPYRLGMQKIWTKGPRKDFMDNALKHAKDHQIDFGIKNQFQYIEAAHDIRADLPMGIEMKINYEGQRLYYHEPSNSFMVQNPNGTMQSYYKPISGRAWFDNQKGTYYGRIQ